MADSPMVTTTYRLTVPDWHPAKLNQLLGHWAQRHRLKRGDRQLVWYYARLAGIPPAVLPRRVSLRITLGPRERAGDPDSYWKSLLDSLVHCGLLLDDNRQGVELGTVEFHRGQERATEITLEDLA
jgi:hypothetical protein